MEPCVLTESTFREGFIRFVVLQGACPYKPLQLRPLHTEEEYEAMEEQGFWGLSYQCELPSPQFPLTSLTQTVADRFIQLLAPLTLHHFRKSSKFVYFHCLNLRGLEFRNIHTMTDSTILEGYSGMLKYFVKNAKFIPFMTVPGGSFTVRFRDYASLLSKMKFIKNYKSLTVCISDEPKAEDMGPFCSAVFHPGVEIVSLAYSGRELLSFPDPVAGFAIVLSFCMDLKFLSINFNSNIQAYLPAMKAVLEEWSLTTSRLEFCHLNHCKYKYQLHEHRLKRCLKIGQTWYWDEQIDFNRSLDTFGGWDAEDIINEFHKRPVYWVYWKDVLKRFGY